MKLDGMGRVCNVQYWLPTRRCHPRKGESQDWMARRVSRRLNWSCFTMQMRPANETAPGSPRRRCGGDATASQRRARRRRQRRGWWPTRCGQHEPQSFPHLGCPEALAWHPGNGGRHAGTTGDGASGQDIRSRRLQPFRWTRMAAKRSRVPGLNAKGKENKPRLSTGKPSGRLLGLFPGQSVNWRAAPVL